MMLEAFLKYIQVQQLFQKGDKVLLAVSGGKDSVAMAYLFHEAKLDFGIAHVNFHLREQESDLDQLFVKKMAESFDVPFYTKDFDTQQLVSESKDSTQMIARELRYEWFRETVEKEGYDYLATAHHLNDSVETALYNLSKGTGVSGLRGILPIKNKLVRPLMFASSMDIERYIKEKEVQWREDSSNASDKYKRNFIRHQIIPLLKEINPSLEKTFADSSLRLRAAEEMINLGLKRIKQQAVKEIEDGLYLRIAYFEILSEPVGILYEILKEYGFTLTQVKDIWESRNGQSGKYIKSENYMLSKDRGKFILTKNVRKSVLLQIGGEGEYEVGQQNIRCELDHKGHLEFRNDVAYLDQEKLIFPLVLRPWKEGDWFMPLGMKGKKKLSDFVIDKKIPLNFKDNILVLVSGKDIVWVMGLRLDERYKVTQWTKKITKLEVYA